MAARKQRGPRGREERGTDTENKALDLRKQGHTYAAIAVALGLSEAGAFAAVKRGLVRVGRLRTRSAKQLRRLELERVDAITAALWPKVNAGDSKAATAVLKAMERRSRLLGLDAPTKTESKVHAVGGAVIFLPPKDDDPESPK